jgi:hypothetical protein
MWILDIILLLLWAAAWIWTFISGSDSLYKLFLGLIIWFLMYLVVAGQVEITLMTLPRLHDWYQNFLLHYATWVLTTLLVLVPILGIFFMLNPRIIFVTRKKSISQLLLWLLLPIFLIGILAYLADTSILSESLPWQRVFEFLESSGLYQIFKRLPWVIFLLVGFLVFYKSLFLLIIAFSQWLYKELILQFFKSWKEEKNLKKNSLADNENFEEE